MASQDWLDKDFYAVLGVSKDVADDELKKTYRKLARKYHPDSNPDDPSAEARFKEISEAYAVLSDQKQRQEYDSVRAMGSGARFAPGAGGSAGFEDLFGGVFGGGAGRQSAGFGDIFSMFGGGQPNAPTRGRDVRARTRLSFAQAISGATVSLRTADGSSVRTKIPAGVKDGATIRIRGKGEQSRSGGQPGDLLVTVSVEPHPVFGRDGNNLTVTVPVTFAEAALGATVEVPTFSGESVRVKVPAGTPSGRTLRVKGRGVAPSKGQQGDLLVTVEVTVPRHLDAEARAAVERLAALDAEDPRADLLARARHDG